MRFLDGYFLLIGAVLSFLDGDLLRLKLGLGLVKAIARGIEARSDQSRESRVMRTVMLINVGEGGLVVAAGVGIAAPVIDRKTTRASLVLQR